MIATKLKEGQYPPPVFNCDLTPRERSLLLLVYYGHLRSQDIQREKKEQEEAAVAQEQDKENDNATNAC